MLVKTSLHDSQVMYWEPAKYVAKLRTLKTDNNPLLLVTNMQAGHGGASGRYDYLKEIAFDYAFLLRELGSGAVESFFVIESGSVHTLCINNVVLMLRSRTLRQLVLSSRQPQQPAGHQRERVIASTRQVPASIAPPAPQNCP